MATTYEFSTSSIATKAKAFGSSWIVIVCAATVLALALLASSGTSTPEGFDDPWIVQGP